MLHTYTFEFEVEQNGDYVPVDFEVTYKVFAGCKGYSDPLRGIYEQEEPASVEIQKIEELRDYGSAFGIRKYETDNEDVYDYVESIEDKLLEEAADYV